jgi:hypothetical protein
LGKNVTADRDVTLAGSTFFGSQKTRLYDFTVFHILFEGSRAPLDVDLKL